MSTLNTIEGKTRPTTRAVKVVHFHYVTSPNLPRQVQERIRLLTDTFCQNHSDISSLIACAKVFKSLFFLDLQQTAHIPLHTLITCSYVPQTETGIFET